MKLTEYIKQNHEGNNSAFARSQSVDRQKVNQWIKADWIIIDDTLYSPKRELKINKLEVMKHPTDNCYMATFDGTDGEGKHCSEEIADNIIADNLEDAELNAMLIWGLTKDEITLVHR